MWNSTHVSNPAWSVEYLKQAVTQHLIWYTPWPLGPFIFLYIIQVGYILQYIMYYSTPLMPLSRASVKPPFPPPPQPRLSPRASSLQGGKGVSCWHLPATHLSSRHPSYSLALPLLPIAIKTFQFLALVLKQPIAESSLSLATSQLCVGAKERQERG